jgi:hypothetical protein
VSGATLEESTATELAARQAGGLRAVERSAATRDWALSCSRLRVHQGSDQWASFDMDLRARASTLTESDRAIVHGHLSGQVMTTLSAWVKAASKADDLSPLDFRACLAGRLPVAGPDPGEAVVEEDMLAAENVADQDGERWLREVSPDDLPAWCAALGQLAGVWSPVGLAAASVSAGLRCAGPSWESYTPAELVALAIGLRGLAALRLRVDGPPEPLDACGLDREVEVEAWLDREPAAIDGPGLARCHSPTRAANDDGPTDDRWLALVGDDEGEVGQAPDSSDLTEWLDSDPLRFGFPGVDGGREAEVEKAPDLDRHGAGPRLSLPGLDEFASMDKRDRIDLIRAAVGMRGLWDSFEDIAEKHTGRRHTNLNRWDDLSLTSLYGQLTG